MKVLFQKGSEIICYDASEITVLDAHRLVDSGYEISYVKVEH